LHTAFGSVTALDITNNSIIMYRTTAKQVWYFIYRWILYTWRLWKNIWQIFVNE